MLVNDPAAAHFEIDPSGPISSPSSGATRRARTATRCARSCIGCAGRGRAAGSSSSPSTPAAAGCSGDCPSAAASRWNCSVNQTFDNPADAEWHVFKVRWQAITGRAIADDTGELEDTGGN